MRSRDAYKKSERTHLGIRTRTAARGLTVRRRIRPISTLSSHVLQVVRVRDGHRRRRLFEGVLQEAEGRQWPSVFNIFSSRTTQLK